MTLDSFGTLLSDARGTNVLGELAGSSFETVTPVCRERAIYWPDSSSDKVILGHRIPNGTQEIESKALAINNPASGPTQVVGFSPSAGSLPLLFQREGCTEPCTDEEEWFAYNLNEYTLGGTPPGASSRLWVIRDAHNINNNGEIVVCALKNGSLNDPYVVLLTPMTSCLGDITGSGGGPPDGVINVFDLLELLASWRSCGDGVFCRADITGPLGLENEIDGQVDVFDLLFLLARWGDCGNPLGFIPEDEQDCIDKFGLGEENREELEACLEALAELEG